MNINYVGDGEVVLLGGGGKSYTDIAARFVGSARKLDEILDSPECPEIVRGIMRCGHLACTEFDFFVFGISGYSRVTEAQLIRKRLASYMFASGRHHNSIRKPYELTMPKSIMDFKFMNSRGEWISIMDYLKDGECLFNAMLDAGVAEEDARYIKPQGTSTKALVGMNAHALNDWFKIRCCRRAQTEIRDMANKMLALCKDAQPTLFENSGASCTVLGYCPENRFQCAQMQGVIPTHQEVLKMIKDPEVRKKYIKARERSNATLA